MGKKMTVFVFLFVFVQIFLGPQNVQANTWVIASITQVGQDLGSSIVALTHVAANPVFSNKQFRLNAASNREMLAVALTAVSMGKNVFILINKDGVTIDRIRLKNY